MFEKLKPWHCILLIALSLVIAALSVFTKLPIRDFAEVLYFVGGVVIAITAVLALRQIDLWQKQLAEGQKEAKERAQREAISTTIKLCEDYAKRHILSAVKIGELFLAQNIQLYSGAFGDDMAAGKWIVESNFPGRTELHNPMVEFVNELETFAMYFMHRIADESIAYQPIGKVFLRHCSSLYPIILVAQKQQTDPSRVLYANIRGLFRLWNARDTQNVAQRTREDVLKTLEQAAAVVNREAPRPIGTV